MNAQSKFKPVTVGLFHQRVGWEHTDCRGKVRTVKCFTGYNKGKRYPYASVRQTSRPMRQALRPLRQTLRQLKAA